MILRKPIRESHRGTALVEFAFVVVVLVLVMFGIIEYARFLFLFQVADNAAREGARYAVVHTGDGTTKQQVIDEVNARMATRQKEIVGYTVDVYAVNPDTGAEITGTAWNETSFGNSIAVRITGKYRPNLPTLLKMSPEIDLKIVSMMSSEAN
jgi:Flp pilus assembly protein TadG